MKLSVFLALVIFSVQSAYSSDLNCPEEQTMRQLSMNEFKALMVAYNSPAAQELSLEDYVIKILEGPEYPENPEIYQFFFKVRDGLRPPGLRGATPRFPEPVFEIEKDTLEIRRVYYQR